MIHGNVISTEGYFFHINDYKLFNIFLQVLYNILRPLSQSELTPIIFHMGLTHLGSEASICSVINFELVYELLVSGNF